MADPKNAFDLMKEQFTNYGLGDLWENALLPLIQGGLDPNTQAGMDQIELNIRDTDVYKTRFKANEARKAAGLPELSIGSYIQAEQNYKEFMQAAGLPKSFYDEPEDFTRWIENDVSANEAQQRVSLARQWVQNLDPNFRSTMLEDYGVDADHLTAFALDPDRGTALIEQTYNAAVFKGTAKNFGVDVSRDTAEQAYSSGVVSQQQAQQGFASVAEQRQTASKLGSLYGETLDEDALVKEQFNFDGADKVTEAKKKVTSLERANFSGTSGIGQNSLSKKKQSGL